MARRPARREQRTRGEHSFLFAEMAKTILTVKPAGHLSKVRLDNGVRGKGREVDGHCDDGQRQGDAEGEAAISHETDVLRIDAAAVGRGSMQVRNLPMVGGRDRKKQFAETKRLLT